VKKFTHHLAPKPHPIIPLYDKAVKKLESLKRNPEIGLEKESLELISFSESLRAIRKINIVDISGKKMPIRTWTKFKDNLKNPEQFDQTAYEIEIGSALRRSGFFTSFIQESNVEGEKRPDILVIKDNKKIYIECKYRQQTQKEQLYDHMFKEFYWRAMQLMYNLHKFYLICVEWNDVPDLKKVNSEIDLIRTKVKNGEEGFYETKIAKLWLQSLASGNQEFDGSFDIDLEKYLSGNQTADIIMQQANVGIFNGMVKHKNPTVVMFRNISYQVEMIKGILGLLNKAYQQIPEKEIGIVFLETGLSFRNQQIKESLRDLEKMLKGKINLIGRINAIILTKSHFVQRNIKIKDKTATAILRVVESKIIPNKKPNSDIPSKVIEGLKHLKYY
jgi:hypothetical protein